ncbi:MAG: potassium channel protein [Deltaproteobacteria bacterium]|nr:MAG: potassium channel protein [Deltaproteobacteria bacterium]
MLLLIISGASGYTLIEGWSFFDSLYMTVITLTTVGFQEVNTLSGNGRFFTIFLILLGGSFAIYAAGVIVQFVVEGEIRSILGRKRLENSIKKISNHTILCGYGRIGSIVCKSLIQKKIPVVVIEKNAELTEILDSKKIPNISDDSTNERALSFAGIEKASNLIAALGTDTDNVFLVLTARQMNPDLFIVARCSYQSSRQKLFAAGANLVESPYELGAARIAMRIERPTVTDFLDSALASENERIQMEEIPVEKGSYMCKKTLMESGLRKEYNLMVISIKKHNGTMLFNPSFDAVIEANDTMIVIGEDIMLEKLRKALMPQTSKTKFYK